MWLISLVAVVISSYFLARTTANIIALRFASAPRPKAPSAQTIEVPLAQKTPVQASDFKPILERDVFDSADTGQAATPTDTSATTETTEETIPTGEAVPTTLGVKLISTFAVGEGLDGRSSCVISGGGAKGSQDVYTVGGPKQFAPDTKLTKILFNRVEFTNHGRLEYVELEDFAKAFTMNQKPVREPEPTDDSASKEETKIEKKAEGSFVIDRAEIDAALANLDKLYTEIRAVPHFIEGKPSGLKLLSVKTGSLFSKLGLQRGDILKKINGSEIDMKKGLELFNSLKTETHITLEVDRKGQNQSLDYDIR